MIQITLTDNYGNILQLGDVIMIHYDNPKIKFIGELAFDDRDCRFIISDGDDWKTLNSVLNKTVERLCSGNTPHKLHKQYGRIEDVSKAQLGYLYSLADPDPATIPFTN